MHDADGRPEEQPIEGAADPKQAQKRLRDELARLKFKLEHSTDKDIRAVLLMRIDQIVAELGPAAAAALKPGPTVVEEEPAEEEEPTDERSAPAAPLTPEQLQEVDRLIRQARVEKMRGNAAEATNMLQEAANLAPSSAPVLEALGDNLMERRQVKPAVAAYKKALRINPRNVGLEEKLATSVLRMDVAGSVEDQLRRGMSDSPFLTSEDIVARTPYAFLLSGIFPGAGHLALGKTGTGLFLLLAWIAGWVVLLVKHDQVENLAKVVAGRSHDMDMSVIGTIFVMAIIWFAAMASLKPRSVSSRRTIEHPVPPANLPFE